MSRCKLFKPTTEQIEKYKPYNNSSVRNNSFFIKSIEAEILVQCMSNNDDTSIRQLFDDFYSKLKIYESCVSTEVKYNTYASYKENEDGILEISGYHEKYSIEDVEYITYEIIEDLVLFAKVVKCDNYFADNSNFHDFKYEIKDKLEYIKSVYYDNELNCIINEFKDTELSDDDFDNDGNLII